MSWANVHAGVPQGSILDPLLFLIYINDLSDNLTSNAKLFADDTSLFSVVHDLNTSAKELNDDLKIVNDWAFQWKIKNKQKSPGSHFQSQIKEIDPPTFSFQQ